MKVYICGWCGYETYGIAKIFDSEDKAKEWLKDAYYWFNMGHHNQDKRISLGLDDSYVDGSFTAEQFLSYGEREVE